MTTPPETLARLAREKWDAIVLGAGPAGAIAARELALRGRGVLLVEKKRLPRSKVCGGCLGGAALEALASIGLGRLPLDCGAVRLNTFSMVCDGVATRIPFGVRVAVSRKTFDDALVCEAAKAGVAVCDNVRGTLLPAQGGGCREVELRGPRGAFIARASVVIVATGLAPCPVGFATSVSGRSYVGLGAVLGEAPIPTSAGVLHMACSSRGYAGVTAVEGGSFVVAAAADPLALALARDPGALVQDIFSEAHFPPLTDLSAIHWYGTPPLTRHTSPIASHRCLLIGDAVRYVEPFTGEGIGWAIHSALAATRLMAAAPRDWDAELPARWQQLHRSALGPKQDMCRALTKALRSRLVRRLVTSSLHRAPSSSRPIVRWLDRPL